MFLFLAVIVHSGVLRLRLLCKLYVHTYVCNTRNGGNQGTFLHFHDHESVILVRV